MYPKRFATTLRMLICPPNVELTHPPDGSSLFDDVDGFLWVVRHGDLSEEIKQSHTQLTDTDNKSLFRRFRHVPVETILKERFHEEEGTRTEPETQFLMVEQFRSDSAFVAGATRA